MDRFRIGTAFCMIIAAGCASAPDPVSEAQTAQALQPAQAMQTGQAVQTAQAAQAAGETPLLASESEVELEPIAVSATALDDRGQVTCRDMLKFGSNVIVTYCHTEEGWKRFKRQQEIHAQQMLRAMQGSGFR